MEKNRLTIRDIARISNVSESTVSRVLNNHPAVSDKTRRRILKIIDELEFQPSSFARGLVTGKSKLIGFITEDIRNPFLAEIYRGVEDYAREKGINVVMFSTDGKKEKEIEYLQVLKGLSAGVILTSVEMKESELLELASSFPIVLVNRFYETVNTDMVVIDNFKAGYLATKHLIELGHKKIAYISGLNTLTANRLRTEGYRKALADHDLSIDEELIFSVDQRLFDTGADQAKELLESNKHFTAIFANSDLLAIGSLDVLLKEGIKVPEEISIIGLDNIQLTSFEGINLTTINQPGYEMGKTSCELLLNRVSDRNSSPKSVVFQPSLVKRKSTGKAKSQTI